MSTHPCPCGGSCACHGGNGAFPTACDVVGGCGSVPASATSEPTQPSRCRRGEHCMAAEDVDDQPLGALAERSLCKACIDQVTNALRDAPALYVDLRLRLRTPGGAGSGERVTRSKGLPLPLNASALDLTEQLHWLATTWADEVISTAGRPTPDRTSQPEAQQVDDGCFLLRTYLGVWVDHPEVELNVTRTATISQAGWFGAALLIDWKRAARRALGLTGLTHRPPEPCPACNVPGVLERRDGDDKVRCTNCGKAWTLKMYETFVHAWVGAAPAGKETDEFHLGEHRGPSSAAAGQDARRGAAAHTWVAAT